MAAAEGWTRHGARLRAKVPKLKASYACAWLPATCRCKFWLCRGPGEGGVGGLCCRVMLEGYVLVQQLVLSSLRKKMK